MCGKTWCQRAGQCHGGACVRRRKRSRFRLGLLCHRGGERHELLGQHLEDRVARVFLLDWALGDREAAHRLTKLGVDELELGAAQLLVGELRLMEDLHQLRARERRRQLTARLEVLEPLGDGDRLVAGFRVQLDHPVEDLAQRRVVLRHQVLDGARLQRCDEHLLLVGAAAAVLEHVLGEHVLERVGDVHPVLVLFGRQPDERLKELVE